MSTRDLQDRKNVYLVDTGMDWTMLKVTLKIIYIQLKDWLLIKRHNGLQLSILDDNDDEAVMNRLWMMLHKTGSLSYWIWEAALAVNPPSLIKMVVIQCNKFL